MTYRQLVEYWGGTDYAAAAMGMRADALRAWRKTGVPPGRQWQAWALSHGDLVPEGFEEARERAAKLRPAA